MDKIWVIRETNTEGRSLYVSFHHSEDAAFKKLDKCKKEAEEDGFENYFSVQGPYHVE